MRVPFEKLMEAVAGLSEADAQMSMGELAGRLGEPDPWRVADAATAVRVCNGERTYVSLSPVDIRAQDDEVVRRAREADRGGVVSGFSPWQPGE